MSLPAYNFAYLDEQTTRMIRRAVLKAIAIPGYHLATLDAACALQDDFPAIRLLFDSYHARVMGQAPAAWVTANAGRIGHVHIADHPGRREPGSGGIDFAALRAALGRARYEGAIGFEYIPTSTTTASLGFLPGWARGLTESCST